MARHSIKQIVQFVLDAGSRKKLEKDGQASLKKATDPKTADRNLRVIDRGFERLRRAALKLGAVLVATFGVRALGRWGADAIRVAAEAEAIWNDLAQAVNNTGLEFEDVRGEIEATARAMQDVTKIGDEEFAQVLTELITTTNDYERSLQNVGVVADLAAAKKMDLRTAAQLVGRAMMGQTSTLTRYGIIVQEGADAVEVLRHQFRGFAENEAKTFQGRLAQLNNEWADFKQAVGEALLAAGDGTSVLQTLIETVKVMTEWVNESKDTFTGLGTVIKSLGKPLLTLVELYARLTQGASMLAKAQNVLLSLFPGGVFDRLVASHEARIQSMDQWARSVLQLVERLRRGEQEAVTLPPPYRPRVRRPPPPGAPGKPGAPTLPELPLGLPITDFKLASYELREAIDGITVGFDNVGEAAGEASLEVLSAMDGMYAAAWKVNQAFAESFEQILTGQVNVAEGAKDLGLKMVASLIGGMAQYHQAMAIGKLAEGGWPPNPAAIKSAMGHFLAAGLFRALEAMTQSAARGGSRAGGYAGSGAGSAGGRFEGQPTGPEIHIYLDPMDPDNPLHQLVVKRTYDLAYERFGEQVPVNIHRGRGT